MFTFLMWWRVSSSCAQHEGMLKGKGIATFILNLGTKWKWAVSFMSQPLYTWRNSPAWQPEKNSPVLTEQEAGWTPELFLIFLWKRKISCHCHELNCVSVIVQPIAQSLYWLCCLDSFIKVDVIWDMDRTAAWWYGMMSFVVSSVESLVSTGQTVNIANCVPKLSFTTICAVGRILSRKQMFNSKCFIFQYINL